MDWRHVWGQLPGLPDVPGGWLHSQGPVLSGQGLCLLEAGLVCPLSACGHDSPSLCVSSLGPSWKWGSCQLSISLSWDSLTITVWSLEILICHDLWGLSCYWWSVCPHREETFLEVSVFGPGIQKVVELSYFSAKMLETHLSWVNCNCR